MWLSGLRHTHFVMRIKLMTVSLCLFFYEDEIRNNNSTYRYKHTRLLSHKPPTILSLSLHWDIRLAYYAFQCASLFGGLFCSPISNWNILLMRKSEVLCTTVQYSQVLVKHMPCKRIKHDKRAKHFTTEIMSKHFFHF